MPDILYDDEASIPEGLKGTQTKNDLGKFVVKVVPEAKLVEFRDNNIALSKERDTLKAQWDKVVPLIPKDKKFEDLLAEIDELRATNQKVADGKLKTTEDIEAEVTKRTQQMKVGYDSQLAEEAKKRASAEVRASESDRKFNQSLVDRCITDAVLSEKSGVETQALPDILNRAYGVFHVEENGNVVPRDGESAVIYGADGTTPMTAFEWIQTLKERAPHFFKGSSGGGAAGNKGKTDYNGMTREEFNRLPALTRLGMANEGKVKNA
jgi:hypothetical protein